MDERLDRVAVANVVNFPTEGVDPEIFNNNNTSSEIESPLDYIANIAETANAVASLVVGHRKILVEGGFDPNLADQMCATLHSKLLGLGPVWSFQDDEDDDGSWVDDEDDE